ncbi:MAG TPA: hypothetical protein VGL72_33670, partial [Bryobacteraceae bacterium]
SNVVNCFNAASAAGTAATASGTGSGGASTAATALNLIQGGRDFFQDGMYINYRIDMPVPIRKDPFTVLSNVEIISELHSDWFFRHATDTPVDTRFLFDAKESVNIPFLMLFSGKLSLAPTFELIYYQNKVTSHLYHSISTSISLNYSFDWHNGLSFQRAAGYQNPTPALPTLPSR